MDQGASTGWPAFDNSYARELQGFSVAQAPTRAPSPRLVRLNHALAAELGFDPAALEPVAAGVFSGNDPLPGMQPIAQAYAGHQFGGFSPQLGDGRALLLAEVIDRSGHRRDIALKGSGRTPFSRGGDGFAALGPVLREYLIGEAMHALGVPTTRALAAVTTGAPVYRETQLPGAVLTRVASSHLRIGTFQFFAARGQTDKVQALADYAIARHDPGLIGAPDRYLRFFDRVAARQSRLVAQWMGLGFVHGVMNTDNMTISGETIDYGPCAFLDAYDPATVFSSIDRQGRYAYGNQPRILLWNLARLIETLLPLFGLPEAEAIDLGNARLDQLAAQQHEDWLAVFRRKLGLSGAEPGDATLITDFLSRIEGADFTLAFRHLARAAEGDAAPLAALLGGAPQPWLDRWQERRAPGADLRAANPRIIPRNHRVEEALVAAHAGDLAPFEALLAAITDPYSDVPGREAYGLPPPSGFGTYVTFCGT